MMKRFLGTLMLASLLVVNVAAEEGMWLPLLIQRLNYTDMQANGLQLTAEELYSVNNGSLKDAIVSFGGFCTAEVISSQGLLLTNHHCGYEAVQSHSTDERNYLRDGFWAMDKSQELPNDGLYARFLVRMEDVTNDIMGVLTPDMSETERQQKISEKTKELVAKAKEGNSYDVNVKSFFHGNEFYLFVYETYKDVRLVGAPAESIGKFGGDTDNWMWPRHTGDFSMFRVYMSADGKPAEYSADNVPLRPKHHLPVSMDGVKDGDFTMIFGYPGSTDRYLSSFGVQEAIDLHHPAIVKVRDMKLGIMRKYMDRNPAVNLAYASNYARIANYWKYFLGQAEQLKRNRVYEKKAKLESEFTAWIAKDPARQEEYGEVMELFRSGYAAKKDFVVPEVCVIEAGLTGPDIALFAFQAGRQIESLLKAEEKLKADLKEADTKEAKEELQKAFDQLKEQKLAVINAIADEHFFENYQPAMDQELMARLFALYAEMVPEAQHPAFFTTVQKKMDGNFAEFAEDVFESSIFRSREALNEFLEKPKMKKLQKDLMFGASMDMFQRYQETAAMAGSAEEQLNKAYRLFTKAIREMRPDQKFAPDANSTMRMTWGKVGSYEPADGVFYNYYTTANGIYEKEDPNNREFVVPSELLNLIKTRDFGRYAMANGELPVCFISNNDITGGNSGSPVINGRGELIGCAFDGNWEAMSGDIFFETNLQRTISVDIRYVLFIIDKLYGAGHLVEEMTLVSHAAMERAEAAPPVTTN